MKKNPILRISILPLIILTVLSFTNFPPQKGNDKNDKGNKSQEQSPDKGNNNQKGNGHNSQGNGGNQSNDNQSNDNQGNKNDRNGNAQKSNDHVNKNSHGNGNKSHDGNSNDKKNHQNTGNDKYNHEKGKMNHGNGNSKKLNGKRDADIDWNLNDFANRKHPKDNKKVTICHHPSGDNSNSVSINISENAVKAHLSHGDQIGNCTNDYSDRWSSNYIKSRENVYNQYEQSWETMSYSEAVLKLALNKLLGIRTTFTQNRSTYTNQEIQRREALIYDLQNNVNSLQNQLGTTRQALDSDVNIIIKL